jgi:hypothetical protein
LEFAGGLTSDFWAVFEERFLKAKKAKVLGRRTQKKKRETRRRRGSGGNAEKSKS